MRAILYQAAIVASVHNPVLKVFAQRLKDKGMPHKVVMIAVARKLVVIANAMIRNGTVWDPETEGNVSADPVHSSAEKAEDESGHDRERRNGEAGSAKRWPPSKPRGVFNRREDQLGKTLNRMARAV